MRFFLAFYSIDMILFAMHIHDIDRVIVFVVAKVLWCGQLCGDSCYQRAGSIVRFMPLYCIHFQCAWAVFCYCNCLFIDILCFIIANCCFFFVYPPRFFAFRFGLLFLMTWFRVRNKSTIRMSMSMSMKFQICNGIFFKQIKLCQCWCLLRSRAGALTLRFCWKELTENQWKAICYDFRCRLVWRNGKTN